MTGYIGAIKNGLTGYNEGIIIGIEYVGCAGIGAASGYTYGVDGIGMDEWIAGKENEGGGPPAYIAGASKARINNFFMGNLHLMR
jgi:hypothetical protein